MQYNCLVSVTTVYLFSHDSCFFSYQFKRFHRELIGELEKKTDMDVKYMTVSIFPNDSVIRHCSNGEIFFVWVGFLFSLPFCHVAELHSGATGSIAAS